MGLIAIAVLLYITNHCFISKVVHAKGCRFYSLHYNVHSRSSKVEDVVMKLISLNPILVLFYISASVPLPKRQHMMLRRLQVLYSFLSLLNKSDVSVAHMYAVKTSMGLNPILVSFHYIKCSVCYEGCRFYSHFGLFVRQQTLL